MASLREKLKKPREIRATYRIVTPMFIGDADQKASGISPASIKGALRFWWRALNWGRIQADIKSDREALQRLHKEEGELFGTSAENGQGAIFSLSLVSSTKEEKYFNPLAGVQYLLGQGLYNSKNGLLRTALSADSFFDVVLCLSPKVNEKQQQQLVQALLALGVLGGLGSRARKGFGSLVVDSLRCEESDIAIPTDVNTLKKLIKTWGVTQIGLPPFTAFSNQTRVDISLQGKEPLAALNEVGCQQQLYRSYGIKGKVGLKDAERNFVADHDLVMNLILKPSSPNTIPKRSVFGLPHNYFFSSFKPSEKVDFPSSKEKDGRQRRASPLFIHVHQFPDKQVALLQTLLPAIFLPDKDKLTFKVGKQKPIDVKFDETMIDWKVIHAYMDRFEDRISIL